MKSFATLATFALASATLYTEDAGTDMSLNKNLHAEAFCAEGYILVESDIGTFHNSSSFDTGNGTVLNGTSTLETCEKCPGTTTSAGGTSRSCHAVNDDWETCTHMGCELENVATKACAYHGSSNPKDDLNGSIAIVETKCHEWNDKHTVQRIKVFHHGHEQAGTSHKCKLTGAKTLTYATDIARACECECKTTTLTEQDAQQASKAADDAMYAIRAAAQALHTANHRTGDAGEHPYNSSTAGNTAAKQHAGTPY